MLSRGTPYLVIRRRRQLVRDRVRTQSRIKAELRFYSIHLEEPRGRWTQIYFETLQNIRFGNRWMQESFNRLLEQYEFLSAQIDKQTQLLRELSETGLYRERVEILQSIPGVGIRTAEAVAAFIQNNPNSANLAPTLTAAAPPPAELLLNELVGVVHIERPLFILFQINWWTSSMNREYRLSWTLSSAIKKALAQS